MLFPDLQLKETVIIRQQYKYSNINTTHVNIKKLCHEAHSLNQMLPKIQRMVHFL